MDAWGRYLFLAAALVPVLVPMGPAQTAIIDPINLIAIVIFLAHAIGGGKTTRVPFVVPALMITVASLIATFNAVSPGASLLTLGQDAYLFLWFVMLVNVMRSRQELKELRIAWVVVACVVAILGVVLLVSQTHVYSLWRLIGPKGNRATGTFTNTNMLSSYLVLSLFLLLSLERNVGRVFKWVSLGILGVGLLATKSNGGIVSFIAGLAVWAPLRSWIKHRSPTRLAAGVLLAVAAVMTLWWLYTGWGLGSAEIKDLQKESSLGRAAHSSEERGRIWTTLFQRWTQSPLGIGPGNSRWQEVGVSSRERKTSYFSKEAHNDSLAYLVERGPLGLLGLVVTLVMIVVMLTNWLKQRAARGEAEDSGGSLPSAMAGAMTAWVVFSFTHETLHLRHYWLFLAMLCALSAREAELRGLTRLAPPWRRSGRPEPHPATPSRWSPET
jgi:hypothetical protein